MLKIRLMRIGTKKRPFYRVVAVDERSKRTGAYIENLGTYNPLTEPKEVKLNKDRIDYWIKKGAQQSSGYLRIIGKAPQRPPRKPKKPTRNASQSDAGGEKKAETPAPAAKPAPEELEESVKADVPVAETKSETDESPSDVIASEAKQSTQESEISKIATEPPAPRNDENAEEKKE